MVIKRKEKKKVASSEVIENIINRGGSTVESGIKEKPSKAEIRFTLRIPAKLIKKLDEARKVRDIKISRNHWILEAISKAVK